MRKLVAITTALLILSSINCRADQKKIEILPEEITLPSISKILVKPGDDKKPETTIEEMVQCIGNDINAHRDAVKLQQNQKLLEEQYSVLVKSIEALKQNEQLLETDRKLLQQKVEQFQLETKRINENAAIIEKDRKGASRSPSSVQSFNARVATYNSDLTKQQAIQRSLQGEQEIFNERIAAYNKISSTIKQKSELLAANNEEFQKQATELSKTYREYSNNCAGEKYIRK